MQISFQHFALNQTQPSPQCDIQSSLAYPSRTIVHAKLEMTEPGDYDEQEADAVANTIAQGGKISRKISGGSGPSGITVSNQMESQLNHLQGGGQAMPTGLRNMMESGFGQDFSHVRLHTDSEAASLSSGIHAKAFTHGSDIYFNQGQFSPNTAEGQKLMAHELTHVVQGTGKVGRYDMDGAGWERLIEAWRESRKAERRDADESKCTDKESDIDIKVSFNNIEKTELGQTATGFLQYIDPQTQISKNIKVTSGGISNRFGASIYCSNSCDYIPQGDYEILDNNGRTDSFRLEFKDDKYDDKVQGGREFFRLHKKGQGNTIGCISVDDDKDWDELYKTLKPDKTSYNTCKVESKSRNPFSPKYEQINKYGTLHVKISHPSQTVVHPKLELTEPGDSDEQEADAAASEVMSGKVCRKISGGGAGGGMAVSSQMESQLNHLQGGGQTLPAGLRGMMERGFDRDFSQVRLHTDSEAAGLSSSIHAKAFTHGNDIYFNRGQFSPETSKGQRLVAHELAHVAQGGGKVGRDEADEQSSPQIEKMVQVDCLDEKHRDMLLKDYLEAYDVINKCIAYVENIQKRLNDISMGDMVLVKRWFDVGFDDIDIERKVERIKKIYMTMSQEMERNVYSIKTNEEGQNPQGYAFVKSFLTKQEFEKEKHTIYVPYRKGLKSISSIAYFEESGENSDILNYFGFENIKNRVRILIHELAHRIVDANLSNVVFEDSQDYKAQIFDYQKEKQLFIDEITGNFARTDDATKVNSYRNYVAKWKSQNRDSGVSYFEYAIQNADNIALFAVESSKI